MKIRLHECGTAPGFIGEIPPAAVNPVNKVKPVLPGILCDDLQMINRPSIQKKPKNAIF
jgi:hypothetical protein